MKKIIHIDMDCFYAAVEIRNNPELAELPVAIGGAVDRRGVIATCNYVAREFGVRSAMATSEALRRCPNLVLVKGHMQLYKDVSVQIREIFARYTHLIEPLSLDEAYLDVTQSNLYGGSATLIANSIRKDIETELNLTASAGVAPCKFIAKIASDENKPNGICVVAPHQMDAFVHQLALRKIPGVGKKTGDRLEQAGLTSCADVQNQSLEFMLNNFGSFGAVLWDRSHGIDDRDVEVSRDTKSVSVETTLSKDVHTENECIQHIDEMCQDLHRRLNKHLLKKRIKHLKVKLKFSDFDQTTTVQACDEWSPHWFKVLLQKAMQKQNGRGIRLVGIGVGLEDIPEQEQLPFHF